MNGRKKKKNHRYKRPLDRSSNVEMATKQKSHPADQITFLLQVLHYYYYGLKKHKACSISKAEGTAEVLVFMLVHRLELERRSERKGMEGTRCGCRDLKGTHELALAAAAEGRTFVSGRGEEDKTKTSAARRKALAVTRSRFLFFLIL